MISLWEVATWAFSIPSYLLPPPSDVILAMFASGKLWLHLFFTLRAVLMGFSLAIVVGIALAILIVHSRHLERGVYPLIAITQSVPKAALAPVFVFWIGIGIYPKILIAFLITFFPIFINSMRGFKIAESDLLDLAHSMRATKRQIFTKIRFPRSLPYIFTGLRIAAPLSVIGAVLAEFFSGSEGLGYLVLMTMHTIDTSLMFACLILMAAIGITLFGAVILAEKRLLPWYKR